MRCDCINHCSDGEDEKNCDEDSLNRRFECADGTGCVTIDKLCNGVKDCEDNSDETHEQCQGLY